MDVGQFALEIALELFVSGAPAIASNLHATAGRLALTRPGTGPNVLVFDTFAPLVVAFRRATTARIVFDYNLVLRALIRAILDLQHTTLVVNDLHLATYATDARARFHQRTASQEPASLDDVAEIIADLQTIETATINAAAADAALFDDPPSSHYTAGAAASDPLESRLLAVLAARRAHHLQQTPTTFATTSPPPRTAHYNRGNIATDGRPCWGCPRLVRPS